MVIIGVDGQIVVLSEDQALIIEALLEDGATDDQIDVTLELWGYPGVLRKEEPSWSGIAISSSGSAPSSSGGE